MSASNDVSALAREWLAAEGYALDSKKQPGFSTNLSISRKDRDAPRIALTQLSGDDKVVLTSGIALDATQQASLARMSQEARRALRQDIAAILLQGAIVFQLEEADHNLRGVTFSKLIYADGFTKHSLLTALLELYGRYALLAARLGAAVEGPRTDAWQEVPETSLVPPSPAACARCGAPIRRGARFCGACGTPVSAP